MEITASKRLQSIGAYAFAEVDKEVEKKIHGDYPD